MAQDHKKVYPLSRTNASSLRMLFKSVVLTKLLYAAPIWLKENLDTFKDFYSRVLLKISGATHHPPKEITSVKKTQNKKTQN